MAKQLNVNLAFSADTSKVKAQLQDLQNQLNKLTLSSKTELGITKDIEDASRAAAELSVHLKNATNQQTGTLDFSKLNQSIKQSGTSLQQYGRTLQSLGPQGQQAFMSLAQAVANSEVPIRRTNAMLKEMGTTLANTARWQLSSSMLHGFMGAVQSAYGYAQDLNESLNNIRIVTGQNIDQMAKFAEEANKAARALSTTTTEYTNASLIYYQQGLNDQQVKERTDITIKMANVARQSAEVVSDQMTAVWNNFYDGSKSLEYYADVMTALGAATASSTDEISEGLNKFAAVADTVGLSYEYAASALATVTATTRQSADVVGTAFKTLFARIQDLELGKTLDDGTTLGSYSQALAKVGVQIKDTSGEMKSMDAILEEMAAKWDTLGKAEQIALAQSVAGVRQYTQLIALMDNWDFMEKNLATSNASSGALQKQADIYAESWEAAADRVTAAAENIYKALINDEFFIDLLNGVEKVITFVDHLIDNLGGLKGVLTAIGAIVTKVFANQISQGLTNITYNLKMMTEKGRQAEKDARKKFIDDAVEGVAPRKEYTTDVEKAQQQSMRSQLELQQQYMENADRMNAVEAEVNKKMMDRVSILRQQVIEAEKRKETASKTIDDASYGIITDIAAYNKAHEKEEGYVPASYNQVYTKNIKPMKELVQLQVKIESGAKTAYDAMRTGSDSAEQAITELNKQVQASSEISDEVKQIFASLDKVSTVDEVEAAVRALNQELGKAIGEHSGEIKNVIGPDAAKKVDQYVAAVRDKTRAELDSADAAKQAEAAQRKTSESIKKATGAQKGWADMLVESANLAFSAASALQMLGGAFEQLRDPDVSGWQKFLTVLTTLGMIVPTVISLFSTFKKILSAETVAKIANVAATVAQITAEKKYNKEKGISSKTTKENTRATWADTKQKLKNTWNKSALEKETGGKITQNKNGTYNIKGQKGFVSQSKYGELSSQAGAKAFSGLKTMLGGIGLITAGVMVAVGAVKWGIAQFNKYSDAAKEAAKQAQEAANAYQAVSDSYNTFTSNLSAYQNAQSGLKDMTKGTLEYREAVLKANESAMQLLDTYENLEYTVDADGLIVIDETSLKEAREAQLEILENAQRSKQLADQNAKNKELKAKSVEFQREELSSSQGTWLQVGNAAAATAAGAGSGALIGAGIGMLGGPIGALIGAGIGTIAGAITGVVGSVVAGSAANEEEEAINRLAEVYATAGNAQFATDEAFEKLLREDLKLDDEDLIQSLVDNRESTLELVKEVSANTEAINAQNAAVVQDYFKEQLSKSGLSEEQQAAIASGSGALLNEKTEELYESTYKDKGWLGFGMTDEEVQKAYAEKMNWATDTIDNQDGNKAKYFNKDGTEVGVISDEVARRYLAQQEALKKLTGTTTTLINKFKELTNSSDKYDKALLSYLENKNFAGLTEDEYNDLYQLIISKVDDGNELSKDDVKQYINDVFNNGKALTDTEAKNLGLGFETAEALYNNFFDELLLYNEHRASANDNIASYAKNLVKNSSVINTMSTEELTMMGKQVNKALIESGEEAARYVANTFYQKAAGEAEKVAIALNDIDWSTIDANGLAIALTKAGVSTEYTTDELNTLIDYMTKDTSRAIDVISSSMKTLDEISNLQQDDTISLEQYELLSNELQSYFTLMADGTYKLTQNALDFYQAVTKTKSDILKEELKLKKIEQNVAENIVSKTMDQYNVQSTAGDERIMYGTESSYQEYLDKTIGFSGVLVHGGGNEFDETGWSGVYAPGAASATDRTLGTATVNGQNYDYGISLDTSNIIQGEDTASVTITRPQRDSSGDFKIQTYDDTDYSHLIYETVDVILKSEEKWKEDVDQQHEKNKIEVKTTAEQNKIIEDQLMLLAESSNDATKTAVEIWKEELENNVLTIQDAEDIYDLVVKEGQEIYNRMAEQAEKTQAERRTLMNSLALQAETAKDREKLLQDEYIDEEAYALAVSTAHEAEKMEGLDVEAVNDYAEHLQDAAFASELLFDNMSQETLEDVAAYTMKMNRGVETLASNFEEWGDILKKSDAGSQEFADSLVGVKKAMSDVLGVQEEFISDNFILHNLEDIEKAANGDAEAIDRLAIAASRDILLNVNIQDENVLNEVLTLHDALAMQIPDIEVGATINSGEFLTKAAQIIEAANMTVEQANAYFRSMGFEPNFAVTTATVTRTPQGTKTTRVIDDWAEAYDTNGNIIGAYPSVITETTESVPMEPVEEEVQIPALTTDGGKPNFTLTRTNAGSMNNTSSKNSGGKSGGSGSKPKKAEKVKKSDVVERYKEINDLLEKKADALNDANKAMDRMYGASRLKQMQQQNDLIKDEIDLLKQKKDQALEYLKEDRQAVANAAKEAGVKLNIDENGFISNYTQAMTELYKELDAAINSANADGNADETETEKIDAAQKRIDELKSAMDQYDETRDMIKDLDNQLDEKFYEWQDNNYEQLTYKLELKLELNDSDLEVIDYELNKISDDFYKMAEAAALMIDSSSSSTSMSQLDIYTAELKSYGDQQIALNEAFEKGEISQSSYIEGLKEIKSGIYENLEAIQELDKSMMDYYGNTLDMAADEIAKYTDRMDHQVSVLDHYSSLLEIMGKQNDYKTMHKTLEAKAQIIGDQVAVAKDTLEMYQGQAEARFNEYQDALARGDEKAAELYLKQYEAALAAANEAQDVYLSKAEEWAEALKAVLENKLADIGKTLEEALTGGTSFDEISKQMERASSLQEEYLTTTNKIYETNKMINTAQQAIDKTDNLNAKRRLRSFQEETAQMQNKGKLSKFELEIQQAKYDLLLAEIALEEAQNAKSIVRLKRDSEGNFGYVYTADDQKVAEAEQNALDKENALYNIRLEGANSYVEKYQQTMQEMYDELQDLTDRYHNGEIESFEEYQRLMTETQNHYYQKLEDYSELYGIAIQEDTRIIEDAWSTEFASMTEHTQDWKQAVDNYVVEVKDIFYDYEEEMDQIANETGVSLNKIETSISDVTKESNNLKDALIGEDGLIKAFDDQINAVADITSGYASLRESLNDLIKEYEATGIAANNAIKKQQEAMLAIETTNTALKNQSGTVGEDGSLTRGGGEGGKDDGGGKGPEDPEPSLIEPPKDFEVTVIPRLSHPRETESIRASRIIISGQPTSGSTDPNQMIRVTYNDGLMGNITRKDYDAIKQYQIDLEKYNKTIASMDTGGYTGSWGTEGKLAMLHQKELVLNADDTQNFLTSLDVLHEIIKMIDLQAINSRVGGFLQIPNMNFAPNEILDQQVHIEASFPGVTDRNEIEEAFNNLINHASQFANRKNF